MFLTEYNEQKVMAGFVEEGEEKRAIAIALKLLKRGKETLDEIAEDSGLPIEKVQELAAQNPL